MNAHQHPLVLLIGMAGIFMDAQPAVNAGCLQLGLGAFNITQIAGQ